MSDQTINQNADAFVGRITTIPFLPDGSQMSQSIFYTDASKRAWARYLDRLGNAQLAKFERPGVTSLEQYMKYVKKAATKHQKASRTVKINDFFRPFFRTLGRYMPVAVAASAADPYPSSIIVGGVMCLLKISEEYSIFQEQLAKWLSKLSIEANLLVENDLCIYQYDDRVQDILVDVYGEILIFFKEALTLFENHKTNPQSGLRILGKSIKEDFSQAFGPIIGRYEANLKAYAAATKRCDGQWCMQFYAHQANEALKQERMRQEQRLSNQEARLFHQEQRQHNTDVMSAVSDVKGTIQADKDRYEAEIARIEAEKEQIRKEEKRNKILSWMQSIDFTDEHNRLTGLRAEGTALWLQDNDTYNSWKNATSSQFLWIKGKPGCGKSVLAGETWNRIETMRDGQVAVAHFYCRSNDTGWSKPASVLGSVLKELFHQTQGLYPEIEKLYDDKGQMQTKGPTLAEVLKHLKVTIALFDEVFILIDGLDECDEPEKVIKELQNIACQTTSIVKTIIFSRPEYPAIETVLSGSIQLRIDGGANFDDLKVFIDHEFSQNESTWMKVPDLLTDVKQKLFEKADGTFLYAYYQAKSLRSSISKVQLEKRLATLPKGLNDTYDDALERIIGHEDDEEQDLALRILAWVSNSFRPLSRQELLQALSICSGQKSLEEVDWILSDSQFTNFCEDLVTVDKDGFYRPMHASVKEYLLGLTFNCPSKFDKYRDKQMEIHNTIANSSLTYLLMKEFQGGSVQSFMDLQKLKDNNPFLDYGASYWGDHVNSSTQGLSLQLIWEFLDNKSATSLAMQIVFAKDDLVNPFPFPGTGSSLHVLSYFGLSSVADQRPEIRDSIFMKDGFGHLPLDLAMIQRRRSMCLWLLRNSKDRDTRKLLALGIYLPFHSAVIHEWGDVIDTLISCGYNVNEMNKDEFTPLAISAAQGFIDGVNKFLENGAKKNLQDVDGNSPLLLALKNRHSQVAMNLINAGVQINSRNINGDSALHLAAYHGFVDVVTLLLDKGACFTRTTEAEKFKSPMHSAAKGNRSVVIERFHSYGLDIEVKNSESQTPLHVAALHNSFEAAKTLKDLGADMKALTKTLESVLMLAAEAGSEAFVTFVLQSDSDIEAKQKLGSTALHLAAASGNIQTCKLLLKKGASLEALGENKETPLLTALRYKQVETAKFLLSAGCDPAKRGSLNSPALHYAAHNGLIDMVSPLLQQSADVEAWNEQKHTALHFAARKGQYGFIEELFRTVPGLDPQPKAHNNASPMHLAAEGGYLEIVQFLLEKSTNIEKDDSSNLPIHLAAWMGHEDIVALLLQYCDVNSKGYFGRTILGIAALRGHENLVRQLLQREARTDISDDDGNQPLQEALRMKHHAIAELLIEHGANMRAVNKSKYGIIHTLSGNGDAKFLQRLIGNSGDMNFCETTNGTTPFLEAVSSGDLDTINLLLEKGGGSIYDRDHFGHSAIHRIAEEGYEEILDNLLPLGLEVTTRTKFGTEALYTAAGAGRTGMVSRLLDLNLPVDGSDGVFGGIPLIAAICQGFTDVVNLLIRKGANVNIALKCSGCTPLIYAVECRQVFMVQKLIAAGADPYWRDIFGKSALDYASKHQPTYAAITQAGFDHIPLPQSTRRNYLTAAIRNFVENLETLDPKSGPFEKVARYSYMDMLGYSLVNIEHDPEHYAARIVFFEMWKDLTYPLREFSCDICTRLINGLDTFICSECIEAILCSGCHERYLGGWEMPKTCPKGYRVQENLEKDLELFKNRLLRYLERFGSDINVTRILAFDSRVKHAKLEAYKKWESEYNDNGQYEFLKRPGQEALKLLERSRKLHESGIDNALDIESGTDTTGRNDLIKDCKEFYRMNSAIQEKRPFVCEGHDYIKLSMADYNTIKETGVVFGPDDRVCDQWLASLREMYKIDDESIENEPETGIDCRPSA